MAELLLSFGILAALIVSLLALFTMLLGSTEKMTTQSAGLQFAEARLDECLRQNSYAVASSTVSAGLYTNDTQTQTEYFYRLQSEPLHAVPTLGRGGYLVKVDVWWWSTAPGQARAGQGRMSVSLSRFHYPGGWSVP